MAQIAVTLQALIPLSQRVRAVNFGGFTSCRADNSRLDEVHSAEVRLDPDEPDKIWACFQITGGQREI